MKNKKNIIVLFILIFFSSSISLYIYNDDNNDNINGILELDEMDNASSYYNITLNDVIKEAMFIDAVLKIYLKNTSYGYYHFYIVNMTYYRLINIKNTNATVGDIPNIENGIFPCYNKTLMIYIRGLEHPAYIITDILRIEVYINKYFY